VSLTERLAAVEEALSQRRDDDALKGWLEQRLLLGPDNFEAASIPASVLRHPLIVTSLPTASSDGQEVYYVADAANGVIWHLRYRTAGTAGKKWEFVGGPPMTAEVEAAATIVGAAGYGDLAGSPGPSITAPRPGDYLVTQGARIWNTAASQPTTMSYDIGGAGALDANSMDSNVGVAVAAVHNSRSKKQTFAAATTTIVSKYKNGGGTAAFEKRWLRLEPIRLG
jgi:hypothetical protein